MSVLSAKKATNWIENIDLDVSSTSDTKNRHYSEYSKKKDKISLLQGGLAERLQKIINRYNTDVTIWNQQRKVQTRG